MGTIVRIAALLLGAMLTIAASASLNAEGQRRLADDIAAIGGFDHLAPRLPRMQAAPQPSSGRVFLPLEKRVASGPARHEVGPVALADHRPRKGDRLMANLLSRNSTDRRDNRLRAIEDLDTAFSAEANERAPAAIRVDRVVINIHFPDIRW